MRTTENQNTGRLTALVTIFLILTACSAPQWRIFQRKVDGADAVKPAAQVEGEKRAAAYIAKVTAPPVANPSRVVEQVHEVAGPLSNSLGQPAEPVTADDKDAVIASLNAGLRAKDAQLDRWREFGRKYAGKPLEDTGINLAGPAGLVGLVAVAALCVAFPWIGWALGRALPLLWSFFRRTTEAVGQFTKANPDAGKKLGSFLSDKMDAAHKRLVKRRADAHRITTVAANA